MSDEFEQIKSIPTRIDLKKHYPLSHRTIFERSFWYIFTVVISLIGYSYSLMDLDQLDNSQHELESLANNTLYYFLKISSLVCIVKLIYEVIYAYMYSYIIELEHLTITRGVFLRTRASFPIAKINDVSLKRNLIQLIFGIYAVDVLTASPEMKFGEIYGLTQKNAVDLQSYLLTLVETTLPVVKNETADDVIDGGVESAEVAQALHS